MEIPVDILLKRLRRKGHAITAIRQGAGRSSDSWLVAGGGVINGRNELTAYAQGVGALGPKDTIGDRQLRPDERETRVIPSAAQEEALKDAERFAQTLSGLVFDLSFDGQRDIWRSAVRVAPLLTETNTFNQWRGRNTDRIGVELFGL